MRLRSSPIATEPMTFTPVNHNTHFHQLYFDSFPLGHSYCIMGKVKPVRLSSGAFVPYYGEGGAGQTLLWSIHTVLWGRWSWSDSSGAFILYYGAGQTPLGHSYCIMGNVEPISLSSGPFVPLGCRVCHAKSSPGKKWSHQTTFGMPKMDPGPLLVNKNWSSHAKTCPSAYRARITSPGIV